MPIPAIATESHIHLPRLLEFTRQITFETFAWGKTDCCSMCDRWIEVVTGISPQKHSGHFYSDELKARRIIADAGGMSSLVESTMTASGFLTTITPLAGDVGLVLSKGQLCMSIQLQSGRWFTRNESGFMFINKKAVRAWGVV